MTTPAPTAPSAPAPATPSPVTSGAGDPADAAGTPVASPPSSAAPVADGSTGDAEPDTFPRSVVEKLREEAAASRVKAKTADTLRSEVVRLLVETTGKMADPTDLPVTDDLFAEDGRPDPAKVNEAIDALVQAKPHLARRSFGDVGQGQRAGGGTGGLSLGQVLSGVQRK